VNHNLHFEYTFYPVGQGLFASGEISLGSNARHKFVWVYDCGTSSNKNLLETGIDDLRARYDRIDLLILSHFDKDHISGVVNLLKHVRVGILMLPHLTLEQRLLIAFQQDRLSDDDVFRYYVDTVTTLRGRAESISQILLVPASRGDEGPPYDDNGEFPFDPAAELRIEIESVSSTVESLNNPLPSESNVGSHVPQTRMLKKNTALRVGRTAWEFVPYNEADDRAIDATFAAEVVDLRDKLIDEDNDAERKKALRDLRSTYDRVFGKKQRNQISLFLYAGPVVQRHSSRHYTHMTMCTADHRCSQNMKPCICTDCAFDRLWDRRRNASVSILYTGDGYLNTLPRIEDLVKYISKRRIGNIATLQVMHHGSMHNSMTGLTNTIEPIASVFCADSSRRNGHPHKEVLLEFIEHGPVIVDKERRFCVDGRILIFPPFS
jgi:hypothetical protein